MNNEALLTVIGGALTLIGVAITAWASIRAGRNTDKQKRISDDQNFSLELVNRYRDMLKDTEDRMEDRVNELAEEVQKLRQDLRTEVLARQLAENQRDAAVAHATELRIAWPGPHAPVAPPVIIKDYFE